MLDIVAYPFRFAYRIYYLVFFSVTLTAFFPLFKFHLSKKERFPAAFKVMRTWAYVLQILSFVPLKVTRKGSLPAGEPYIICPNHSSFMDIQCLYVLFKDYFIFTGKKEIESWPLFHIFYTSGMNITVDRKNRVGAYRAFKRMQDELEAGKPVLIFPEGTISKVAPELGEFKEGAFNLAIKAQVPIVPVTFVSNWKRLQRKGLFKGYAGPGLSEVVIHESIPTKGLTSADAVMLSQKVKEVIEEPLRKKYSWEVN